MTGEARPPRQWSAAELEHMERIQERLAVPLTAHQLAVLRRWWNGGYADDNTPTC